MTQLPGAGIDKSLISGLAITRPCGDHLRVVDWGPENGGVPLVSRGLKT